MIVKNLFESPNFPNLDQTNFSTGIRYFNSKYKMVKISTIRTNFGCEKQRYSSRKIESFKGAFHAPAAYFFSAVGNTLSM